MEQAQRCDLPLAYCDDQSGMAPLPAGAGLIGAAAMARQQFKRGGAACASQPDGRWRWPQPGAAGTVLLAVNCAAMAGLAIAAAFALHGQRHRR